MSRAFRHLWTSANAQCNRNMRTAGLVKGKCDLDAANYDIYYVHSKLAANETSTEECLGLDQVDR